jgi:hypothetical protein
MEQPARKTGRGSCTATTYRCCGRLALGRQSNHDASQNAVNQSRPVFERDTQKIASRLVSRDKRTQTRPADQFRINLRARRADRESEQQRQIRPRCRMGKLIIAWGVPHTNRVPPGQPSSSAFTSAACASRHNTFSDPPSASAASQSKAMFAKSTVNGAAIPSGCGNGVVAAATAAEVTTHSLVLDGVEHRP